MAGKNGRDRRPYVKRVQRVEVPEGRTRLRIVLFVAALLVAVGALTYAVMNLLATSGGWQRIDSDARGGETCAGEFVFNYQIGRSGAAAGVETRALTGVYTELTERAWCVYDAEELHPGYVGVAYLNQHPNEPVAVDPWLYRALGKVEKSGSRMLYLAPVYDEYRNIFTSESDAEAANFDPRLNADKAAEFAEITAIVNDPAQVTIELLDEGFVCLRVSPEYLAYAEENGVTRFIDFFWLRNAFIIDDLAEELTAAGYPYGSLTSFDGFTRNFDPSGESYGFNLFSEQEGKVYQAGQVQYAEQRAFVFFRSYAISELDRLNYYRTEDGGMRVPYIGADGLCRAAAPELVGYSRTLGCAELALRLTPAYTEDSLDEAALEAAAEDGVHTIWFDAGELRTTDPALVVAREAAEQ